MAKKPEKPVYAFIRTAQGLVPEMAYDAHALDGVKLGERVRVEIKQFRNLGRFRLYWSMLAKVLEATDCAPTVEHLHSAIKLELGYGTPVRLGNGMTVLVPGSIAFEAMDEAEFQGFFERAAAYLAGQFGIDPLAFYEKDAA